MEDKVEECSARTEQRIREEADSIRADIRAVDGSQAALQDMVAEMSDKMHVVERQTRFSCEGIHLLCSVLDSEIVAATGKRLLSNEDARRSRALKQLEEYTRNASRSNFFEGSRPPLLSACGADTDSENRRDRLLGGEAPHRSICTADENGPDSMVEGQFDLDGLRSKALHDRPIGTMVQRDSSAYPANCRLVHAEEDEETPPLDFTRRISTFRRQSWSSSEASLKSSCWYSTAFGCAH